MRTYATGQTVTKRSHKQSQTGPRCSRFIGGVHAPWREVWLCDFLLELQNIYSLKYLIKDNFSINIQAKIEKCRIASAALVLHYR